MPNDVSVVFVLGGPGSGKGTQCEKIATKYDWAHISAGDLLRDEAKSGSKLGKTCQALMKDGKLVPIETTLSLLRKAMTKNEKTTFLIDGFPRSIDQAKRFEEEIRCCKAVLFFECSEETMVKRLTERGKTSGRVDDNEETIRKRLKTFVEASAPVAEYYDEQGKCFRIDSEGPSEEVFVMVETVLDALEKETSQNESRAIEIKADQAKDTIKEKGNQETSLESSDTIKAADEIRSLLEAANLANEAVKLFSKYRLHKRSQGHQKRVVFVLGGPGSGKGTQCERIVAEFGYKHISVGNLLRIEVSSGTELGQECDALMKEGKLVPVEITLDLLKKAISDDANCFLIDGFPRSIEQAHQFEKEVASCDGVLFFDCSESVMLERLNERAKESGRADDNPETMQKRLETFRQISEPVIQFYSEQGKCHKISAERDPSEIYQEVKSILNQLKTKQDDAALSLN